MQAQLAGGGRALHAATAAASAILQAASQAGFEPKPFTEASAFKVSPSLRRLFDLKILVIFS
jgi:hypothetical protein